MQTQATSPLSGKGPLSIERDVSTWGGLQPAYVTLLPESFAWGKFAGGGLNGFYRNLFENLNINLDTLDYKKWGYRAYYCVNSRCSIDTIYLPIVKCGKYHPHVSVKHSSRCVSRIMPRLNFMRSHNADYLICLDLTTPHDQRFKEDSAAMIGLLRKAINDFLLELRQQFFPGKNSRHGGFYALHTWKTTKPLDFHFHVHLQLFNVALEGKVFHRFNPKLDSRKVRLAWKLALKKFGLWDSPGVGLPVVHLHYIKLTDKARLVHRLRYIYRRPLEDLARNLTAEMLEGFDEAWARELIRYTPRQVFVGFAVRLKSFGLILPKSDSVYCPVCGEVMRGGGFCHELPPGTPVYAQESSNRWRLIEEDGLNAEKGLSG